MNSRRLIVAAVGLSLGLASVHGGAMAQIKGAPIVTGNVDGSCVTAPSANSTGVNAGDWTITCGDLNPGAGMTVIGPPAVVSNPAPPPAPVAAPEPVNEPAPVAEPAPETTETAAVATESDLDADNEPDALEADLGLDPANADTDADGVADGDELNIYSTEPTLFDTDGDGVSDGEELFGIMTDPLVWNDFSADSNSQALAQEAAAAPAPSVAPQNEVVTLAQDSTENLSATNGAAAARGKGNASSAPGSVTRGGVTVPSTSVLGPDGTYKVSETSPPTVSVSGTTSTPPVIEPAPGNASAPAPEAVAAPVETAAPVSTDTAVATDRAVASDTDLDADNYLDAAELEVGLDPNNPDTDGDGVADGDEADIYFTDPFTADSDGDGLADGGELFDTRTDPLVWDTNGNGVSDGEELPV